MMQRELVAALPEKEVWAYRIHHHGKTFNVSIGKRVVGPRNGYTWMLRYHTPEQREMEARRIVVVPDLDVRSVHGYPTVEDALAAVEQTILQWEAGQ